MEEIHHCENERVRGLPYAIPIQTAITYEMNSVKFDLIRKEYMLLDWFAAVGGLVSLALALAQIVALLESPHYFVTSAMIA